MRRLFFVIFTLAFTILLSGCKSGGESAMEKIQRQLNEMEGYRCKGELTRITNKGESKYGIEQYYKATGEYKLLITSPENLKGNYTIYDGTKVCQYSAQAGGKVITDVPESQARNELFLGPFTKNYMQSEDVSVDVAVMDEAKCTVLEAVIPGDNKFMQSEKLWIDNETLLPLKLVIYDKDGKERYIIDYTSFEFNCSFDEGTFTITQ